MSDPGKAPVAVVIVTWNSASYIDACLDSLVSLERPPAEIVVVDNGSSDGTRERLRAHPALFDLIENDENVGFCRATNRGIERTRSPFVLLLNPDAVLSSTFVEHLLPVFDDPLVGIAVGKILRFDRATIDSAGQVLGRSRQPVDRGYGCRDEGQFDREEEVFGACGAAALYRREMLDSIADPSGAVLDEEFFAFYEDLDVAWRARRLGWKTLYHPRAVAYHARGGTLETGASPPRWRSFLRRSPEIRFHLLKNRYLTILRNDTVTAYLTDFPFILARDLAMLGIVVATSPAILMRLWQARWLFGRALGLRKGDCLRSRAEPTRQEAVDNDVRN